ncbi:MAG: hypothetical protein VX530_00400 [Candidatus Neomarinimicrobiota bacterium]|nr:hypothetical protein [Candidatus Neomarinimicrobiota bacterium]MEC7849128.1 hypothetical protein [Candidatus Neomarinimicrobiota bacterium]MED5553518.1 hypothetical protein [Candidatus Neomarinimicrobiota bacterium]
MKRALTYILLSLSTLFGQFDLYPVTDFFGGGIGYSPMYISIDEFPATDLLKNLGLDPTKFNTPFVVHGGEGFAHMTGKWRIGGYAGIGSSSISTITNVQLYVDLAETGYNGETAVDYDGNFDPTIEAKITLSLGAGSIEYVMPIFQDLEISAGAMMGLGRLNLSIDQYAANPKWGEMFNFSYGSKAWDVNDDGTDSTLTYYYAVTDVGDPISGFNAANAPGVMSDLSGTFFNFQPYVAIKWQLLDRVGLRISAGFNKGTIGQGRWKLNSRYLIGDSEEYSLQGVTFRTMLYLGL